MLQNLFGWIKDKTSPPVIGEYGGYGGFWSGLLPMSRVDYAGELRRQEHLNTIVALAVDYFGVNFAASPLVIQEKQTDGTWKTIPHEMSALFESPNPDYSWFSLYHAIAVSYALRGEAFLLLWPNKMGNKPATVHWLNPYDVTPKTDGEKTGTIITHYEYTMPGGDTINLPKERIVFIRRGIDPNNHVRGWSPVMAALREVWGDNKASTFTSAIVGNFGMPPVVFSPSGDKGFGKDAVLQLRKDLQTNFSNENAGRPLIMGDPLRADKLGYSPRDLDLGPIGDRLTARICAAVGFDPMVLNLPSANKTYSNLEQAQQAAYDRTMLPAKTAVAADLKMQVLSTWYKMDPERYRVHWDFSGVAALQDDVDKLWKRYAIAFDAGTITEAEFRRGVGLPVLPEHEGKYSPKAVGMMAAPNPTPTQTKSVVDRVREIRAKQVERWAKGE